MVTTDHNIDEELLAENIELRREYIGEVKMVSGLAIEDLLCWKREKKVFSVIWESEELYPAFQFSEDKPLEVIAAILAELPDDLSSWQIAHWFDANNGWLDGEVPQDWLHNTEEVVQAARHLAEPAIV